jgi:DNA-binding CsgD family transcriptional regulator
MVDLSEREQEIMQWLSDGLTTESMARRGYVSPTTIRNHLCHIFTKLDVHNRMEAIAAWRDVRGRAADRILAYCRRARIPLEPLQVEIIRAAFAAKRVECTEGDHVFVGAATGCLCGGLKLAA